jgi:enterochelin esterase-like enzyme
MQAWCLNLILALGLLPNAPDDVASGTMKYGTFPAPSIGVEEQSYAIYLPPGYSDKGDPYPLVVFLHGLWEDEKRFEHRIGANKIIDRLIAEKKIAPVIVAIPNGNVSFYTNYHDGSKKYEDMLVKDFVPFIDETYNTIAKREGRALTGSSMGGYGALKIAFRHPELFVSIATHSAALLPEDIANMPPRAKQMMQHPRFKQLLGPVFGDPIDAKFWKDENPFFLAHNGNGGQVALRIDCGEQDDWGFQDSAKAFHELLDSLKIPHEYGLYPGDHGTSYLKDNLFRSFVFHQQSFAKTLGAKPGSATPPADKQAGG